MQIFRYQTLVQSQSRDLGLLRKQLEQSRLTTHKLRGIIEDLTRSDQLIDQRRFIQLARRTIRKLEGELLKKSLHLHEEVFIERQFNFNFFR